MGGWRDEVGQGIDEWMGRRMDRQIEGLTDG